MDQITINKKEFYKKVVFLVLPMALQNLINVGVTAADVIMLGKVSETVLSGSSLAGQVQWVMNLIFFGISSGASVLTAQYWGKKDVDTVEKILGIGLGISMMVSIGFFLAALLFPMPLMRIFTKEQAVLEEGVKYLGIVAFSYLIMGFTNNYLNIIRSVERVVISTVVYSISLGVNVCLNYVLIYGNLGAPAMGIQGAAIATLTARIIELCIVLFYAIHINKEVKVRLKYFFTKDKRLFRDFLFYALPVIINELLWGAGYSANAAIIGRLGSSVVAANSVAHVARQLATVVSFGVAGASAIMLGKAIGEHREDLAENYAKRLIRLTIVTGLIGGTVILLIRPLIVGVMGLSGETVVYMKFFLFVMSYYVIAQALNSTWIVGIFRSGGDTRFGLILDVASMWGGSIFLGAMSAFVWKFPIPLVFIILMSDELIKLPFCFLRYRSKKWLRNVTREDEEAIE